MLKFLGLLVILLFSVNELHTQEKSKKKIENKLEVGFSKVGVVDMRKILQESTAYQGVVEQFEDIRRKHRNKITKKEDELRDEENNLFKQKNIISKEAYAKKLKDLSNKANALKVEKTDDIKKYETSFEKATIKIQKSLVDVLSKIASENNIDLILAKDQVLLVGSNIDLTKDSISQLNENLASIKFEINK